MKHSKLLLFAILVLVGLATSNLLHTKSTTTEVRPELEDEKSGSTLDAAKSKLKEVAERAKSLFTGAKDRVKQEGEKAYESGREGKSDLQRKFVLKVDQPGFTNKKCNLTRPSRFEARCQGHC